MRNYVPDVMISNTTYARSDEGSRGSCICRKCRWWIALEENTYATCRASAIRQKNTLIMSRVQNAALLHFDTLVKNSYDCIACTLAMLGWRRDCIDTDMQI